MAITDEKAAMKRGLKRERVWLIYPKGDNMPQPEAMAASGAGSMRLAVKTMAAIGRRRRAKTHMPMKQLISKRI